MAKTVAKGSTDTTMTFSPDTVSLAHLNWSTDWQLLSEKPGEIVYLNSTSSSDQQETFRITYQRVANVYSGTEVSPSNQASVKSGTRLYLELRQTWKETSSTDDAYAILFPMRAAVSVTIPDASAVTGLNDYQDIEAFVRRAYSGLYAPGSLTQTGLKKLLRGILRKY